MASDDSDLLRQLIAQNAELMRQNAEMMREIRAAQAGEKKAAPSFDVPLPELWDQWADWAVDNVGSWEVRKHHRKALMGTVFTIAGKARTLAEMRPSDLTQHTADFYRTARRKAPGRRGKTVQDASVDSEWTTLQMMLTWHVEAGHLERNPVAGWERKGQKRRETYFSPEDFTKFIAHARPLLADMSLVAYRCVGMRNTEVRMLRKSEVKERLQEIHLPKERNKNGQPRIILVPTDAWEVIMRRKAESRGDFVFVMPDDPKRARPVSKSSLWRWWDKCRKESGMEGLEGEALVFHLNRHGGIESALEAGMSIADVSKSSGASVKVITDVYEKFNERRRNVARAKLDAQAEAFKPGGRRGPVGVVPTSKDDAANE